MELQDLIDATEQLLDRSAAGDAEAVFVPEAQEVYDRLLALQADDPDAARAAGRLAWARHLAEGNPVGTENLSVAITLLARFPEVEPPALAYLRTVELPDDVEPARPGAPCHPARLIIGAERMYRELAGDRSYDDMGQLGVQVSLVTLGVEWVMPDGELRPFALDCLAEMILAWIGATGNPELLQTLVAVRRECLAAARPGVEQNDEFLFDLGVSLALLFTATGDPQLLDEAESVLASSGRYGSGPGNDEPPTLESRIADLEQLLDGLVRVATMQETLNYRHLALAGARRALLARIGGQEPDVYVTLGHGGPVIEDRGGSEPRAVEHRLGDLRVVDYWSEGDKEPVRIGNLNFAYARIAQLAGEMEQTSRWDRGRRAELFAELAEVYRERFLQRHRPDFLDRAIALARVAVRRCPRWDARRRDCFTAFVAALLDRYHLSGSAADLDEVIAGLRRLVALVDAPPQRQADDLSLLASLLLDRYQSFGHWSDLRRADETACRAVGVAPNGSDAALVALGVFGQITVVAHGAGAPGADRDAGIERLRIAAGLLPDHVNHYPVLINVAASLANRYRQGGAPGDLDEAIELTRAALVNVAEHSDQWARTHEGRSNMAAALTLRFEMHGALSDLDEAIELSRQVVAALPAGHPLTTDAATALAERLAQRAGRTGSGPDLVEARRLAEQAIADADTPATARAELGLARVLATPLDIDNPDDRASEDNGLGNEAGRAARLVQAIGLRRSATLDALDPGNRIALAALLQELFLARAGRGTDDPSVLALAREAETLYRVALDTAAERATLRLALASVQYERARLDGDRRALDEAAELARTVALDDAVPSPERMAAARIWGAAQAQLGRWAAAAEGFTCAVDLLPQLAPRTLARTDQEFRLAATADLPSDAAVAAVRAGEPATAVRVFEAARGVLWAQLGHGGAVLTALAGAAPELAGRFVQLRAELGGDTGAALPDRRFPYAWRRLLSSEPGTLAERHRTLGTRWQETLAEIRALDGFASFPAAPAEGRLHPGVDGPVVLLAVSAYGGYALIVHPDERIDPLPLPGLTPEAVRAQVTQLQSALEALQDSNLTFAAERQHEDTIGECLAWLSDTITGPVLDRCAQDRTWWIPAGPLAALPIHAAGDALARTCSSYSPTLAALRLPPTTGHARRLLLVAMPMTPDANPLRGVRAEMKLLRTQFSPEVLAGPTATRVTVSAALADCEVAHFACHSVPGTDRSAARLLLHDHQTTPFTLLDVAHLTVPAAQLAYLSSCATSLSGDGLPDEATHLAAAFQTAGFPQVVATLWPVDDVAALKVTTAFYTGVGTIDGAVNPSAAPEALRNATRQLAAAAQPPSPSLWACHIHVGR